MLDVKTYSWEDMKDKYITTGNTQIQLKNLSKISFPLNEIKENVLKKVLELYGLSNVVVSGGAISFNQDDADSPLKITLNNTSIVGSVDFLYGRIFWKAEQSGSSAIWDIINGKINGLKTGTFCLGYVALCISKTGTFLQENASFLNNAVSFDTTDDLKSTRTRYSLTSFLSWGTTVKDKARGFKIGDKWIRTSSHRNNCNNKDQDFGSTDKFDYGWSKEDFVSLCGCVPIDYIILYDNRSKTEADDPENFSFTYENEYLSWTIGSSTYTEHIDPDIYSLVIFRRTPETSGTVSGFKRLEDSDWLEPDFPTTPGYVISAKTKNHAYSGLYLCKSIRCCQADNGIKYNYLGNDGGISVCGSIVNLEHEKPIIESSLELSLANNVRCAIYNLSTDKINIKGDSRTGVDTASFQTIPEKWKSMFYNYTYYLVFDFPSQTNKINEQHNTWAGVFSDKNAYDNYVTNTVLRLPDGSTTTGHVRTFNTPPAQVKLYITVPYLKETSVDLSLIDSIPKPTITVSSEDYEVRAYYYAMNVLGNFDRDSYARASFKMQNLPVGVFNQECWDLCNFTSAGHDQYSYWLGTAQMDKDQKVQKPYIDYLWDVRENDNWVGEDSHAYLYFGGTLDFGRTLPYKKIPSYGISIVLIKNTA